MAPITEAQDPEDTASSGGEGHQTPGARLKPGGPCCVCGATYSSTWYGKKNGKKYCRGNPCKKAGDYNVGKKRKKRGFPVNIYKISRVEACLGFRLAATALPMPALCVGAATERLRLLPAQVLRRAEVGHRGEAQRVGSARLQIRVALACPLSSQ